MRINAHSELTISANTDPNITITILDPSITHFLNITYFIVPVVSSLQEIVLLYL